MPDPTASPRLHRPRGTLEAGGDPVALTPEGAGWTYSGLRVVDLAPGVTRTVDTGDDEMILLPMSAVDVAVTVGDESFALDGRGSVFARVTDFLYVGRDSTLAMTAPAGGEVALATARCEHRLPPRYGPVTGVGIETRGAGPATRQVTNFASPEAWDHADRIMCVARCASL